MGTNTFKLTKDHDTIRVKNLKDAIEFYGTILGLKQISNGGLGDHIAWFALNNKVQLHLVESDDTVEKNKGVHMAFNTIDLKGFMQHLKKHQIHFENLDGEVETTNTRPDGIKQIYFQDPDNYWIEVNDAQL